MNLQLDEKETQALLNLLSLSQWVSGPTDEDSSEEDLEHSAVLDKILAAAGAEPGELEVLQMESGSWPSDKINEYDQDTFWDELSFRLSMRDIETVVGIDAFRSLADDRRDELLDALEEFYNKLFQEVGLEQFKVEGAPSPLLVAAEEIASASKRKAPAKKKGAVKKSAQKAKAPVKKAVARKAAPAKKAVVKKTPAKKAAKKPTKKVAKKSRK